MLIKNTELTPALARWLRESHDDDAPVAGPHEPIRTLSVWQDGEDILVLRADGSELSESERIEITARLAAHAVEPLR